MANTRLTYLGHSTVLIETGRLKILTDPILRERVAGVLRSAPLDLTSLENGLDAVVISHGHYDHLDARRCARSTARRASSSRAGSVAW
jgi:L-ascorbate metabolism protein UlaG (beta-lactamase superfamily)